MKKLRTFEVNELDVHIRHIYYNIWKSAENMALIYHKAQNPNESTLDYFIEDLNDTIKYLKELYSESEKLEYLNKEKMLKVAKEFFETDLY